MSILNSERSNKKETNTPKRTDDLYKQDEIGYQKCWIRWKSHKKVKMTMIQMISNIEWQSFQMLLINLKNMVRWEFTKSGVNSCKSRSISFRQYLLFLDLATWFDQPITSKMRYYRSEKWVMLGHRNTRSSLSEWDALSIWNTCHFLILSGLLMMGFISVYRYNGHVI